VAIIELCSRIITLFLLGSFVIVSSKNIYVLIFIVTFLFMYFFCEIMDITLCKNNLSKIYGMMYFIVYYVLLTQQCYDLNNFLFLLYFIYPFIRMSPSSDASKNIIYTYLFDNFLSMHICVYMALFFFSVYKAWVLFNHHFFIDILLMSVLFSSHIDIFSYLGGKKIGHFKTFKYISPNKTLEGFFSGFLLTFIFIVIYKTFIISLDIKLFSSCSLFTMLLIYLSVYIFEILGDLFASIMKRYKRIKNISNILPGHGGILDRFDSLLPTFFCMYIFYKNIYLIHMLTYL